MVHLRTVVVVQVEVTVAVFPLATMVLLVVVHLAVALHLHQTLTAPRLITIYHLLPHLPLITEHHHHLPHPRLPTTEHHLLTDHQVLTVLPPGLPATTELQGDNQVVVDSANNRMKYRL